MSTDIWDKYRHESDQTITVIGVLILSAKLCVADDHFSIKEEEEILKRKLLCHTNLPLDAGSALMPPRAAIHHQKAVCLICFHPSILQP